MQTNLADAVFKDPLSSIEEQIDSLTAECLLSDSVISRIFEQSDELYQQKLLIRLRERGKHLHTSMKDLNDIIAAYKSSRRKKNRELQKQNTSIVNDNNRPAWYNGSEIDENMFCATLKQNQSIKCIDGILYGIDGAISYEKIENEIHSMISPYIKQSIAFKVKGLVNALKITSYSPPLELDLTHIHLLNGTIDFEGKFTPERQFCTNRLNVNHDSNLPQPENWIQFVNDLLYPDDVLTLQEYLGYCMIPSTKAQKMLCLIGNGGEGKSRILVVLNQILKGSITSGDLKSLTSNRFALGSLENKLAFVDEDIKEEAIQDTDVLKKLVTMETPFLIERKGIQPYEALLYVRLILFGNFALRALYDHSDGMFRRQIVLKVKPVAKGRVNDTNLSEKLIAEKDSIFSWCFQGLQRLMNNNYQFTISQQAKANLEELRHEGCNVVVFLQDENYVITHNRHFEISCTELFDCYEDWCKKNAEIPLKRNSVTRFLKAHSSEYGVEYSEHVQNKSGQRVRGFIGIKQIMESRNFDSSKERAC